MFDDCPVHPKPRGPTVRNLADGKITVLWCLVPHAIIRHTPWKKVEGEKGKKRENMEKILIHMMLG
jgi:hypothetical protein